jgi:hypothetical protein
MALCLRLEQGAKDREEASRVLAGEWAALKREADDANIAKEKVRINITQSLKGEGTAMLDEMI